MTLSLRPYQESDAAIILSWCDSAYAMAQWSADQFSHYPLPPKELTESYRKRMFKGDDFQPLIMTEESVPIGHFILRRKTAETARIGFVILDPKYRGIGLGKTMLHLAVSHAFDLTGITRVTLGVFENNPSARGCYESVGFKETETITIPIHNENWTCIELELLRSEWKAGAYPEKASISAAPDNPLDATWLAMVQEARRVLNPRDISPSLSAGGVAAAVLSASGKIYTGVCVDTSCTLGICAERNVLFNMLTCGENRFFRVVALGRQGVMAPCGACREFMMQLMAESADQVQVLMDETTGRSVSLRELMPDSWI